MTSDWINNLGGEWLWNFARDIEPFFEHRLDHERIDLIRRESSGTFGFKSQIFCKSLSYLASARILDAYE